jgi:hypothetical protein
MTSQSHRIDAAMSLAHTWFSTAQTQCLLDVRVPSPTQKGSTMVPSRWKLFCIAATTVLSFAHAGVTRAAVNVGDKAPNFELPSSTGKPIKLADFAGKKSVVLFFYIGAFTNA